MYTKYLVKVVLTMMYSARHDCTQDHSCRWRQVEPSWLHFCYHTQQILFTLLLKNISQYDIIFDNNQIILDFWQQSSNQTPPFKQSIAELMAEVLTSKAKEVRLYLTGCWVCWQKHKLNPKYSLPHSKRTEAHRLIKHPTFFWEKCFWMIEEVDCGVGWSCKLKLTEQVEVEYDFSIRLWRSLTGRGSGLLK